MNSQRGRLRRSFAIICSLLIVVGSPLQAMATDEEVVFEGAGWGHAVGLPQWGAHGMALDGFTGEEIVEYYYHDTTVAPLSDQLAEDHFMLTDPAPLWIGLLQGKTSISFDALGAGAELDLCNGPNSGTECPRYTAMPGETWSFATVAGGCQWFLEGVAQGTPGTCNGSIKWTNQPEVKVELHDLADNKNKMARGTLRIRTPNDGASFHVSLEIPLEEYAYGVLEVPGTWPPEAMRAQAMAIRSYTTYRILSYGPEADMSESRKSECWCHQYGSAAKDMSYVGYRQEEPPWGHLWVAAVDETAGMVVTHPDTGFTKSGVANTFFSTSSGGATESNTNIWHGPQHPYLISKPDPWSLYPSNPDASWSFSFDEADLAAEFGFDEVDGIHIAERWLSGSPGVVDVVGRRSGAIETDTYDSRDVKTILGLRGHHVNVIDYGPATIHAGNFAGSGSDGVAAFVDSNASWWMGTSDGVEFTTDTWANWNTNTGWINRLVGDFDGDNKDDIAVYRTSSGTWWVGSSDGSKFSTSNWGGYTSKWTGWGEMLAGDYNGDGYDDIAAYNPNTGKWWVSLSTGTSFQTAQLWVQFATMRDNWGAQRVGDFNGDDKDDLAAYNPATGRITVNLSTGSGFTKEIWAQYGQHTGWGPMLVGDFDGDSMDDWASYNPLSGKWWISISTGTSFESPSAWGRFYSKRTGWGPQLVGDFNGDGKDDIANHNPDSGKWWLFTSTGDGFDKANWGATDAVDLDQAVAADVDGNGSDDLVGMEADRSWWIAHSTGSAFNVAPSTAFPSGA